MNAVATKTCCARIGDTNMRRGAPRLGDRCGVTASEVAVVGTQVELHLCRIHVAVLARSDNPHELAKRWLP